MKKLLAFDLDGTLAPSKSAIASAMGRELTRLLKHYELCVISGGKFEQFRLQILDHLPGEAQLQHLHLTPTCGTQYYRYDDGWRQVYAENFTDTQKHEIVAALNDALDTLGMREPVIYGDSIEDRGSQITFSALGQEVVAELGQQGVALKEAWDPDDRKKEALRAYLAKALPEVEVRAGGTTSIDITKPGIDKAYGIAKLIEITGITKDEILFFGDKMQPGGNDYPVRAYGVESREVANPEDTLRQLQSF